MKTGAAKARALIYVCALLFSPASRATLILCWASNDALYVAADSLSSNTVTGALSQAQKVGPLGRMCLVGLSGYYDGVITNTTKELLYSLDRVLPHLCAACETNIPFDAQVICLWRLFKNEYDQAWNFAQKKGMAGDLSTMLAFYGYDKQKGKFRILGSRFDGTNTVNLIEVFSSAGTNFFTAQGESKFSSRLYYEPSSVQIEVPAGLRTTMQRSHEGRPIEAQEIERALSEIFQLHMKYANAVTGESSQLGGPFFYFRITRERGSELLKTGM